MYSIPAHIESYSRTEEIIGTWLNKTAKRGQVILDLKVVGQAKGLLSYVYELGKMKN